MLRSKIYVLVGLILIIFAQGKFLSGQNISSEEDVRVMVQLYEKNQSKDLQQLALKHPAVRYVEALTRDGLIHVLNLEGNSSNIEASMDLLEQCSFVQYVEKEIPVRSRSERPNDRDYFEQFQMMKMEMEEVWCKGNNLLSARGDTIVIAVVEEDLNMLFHPEINDNLWVNHREIPNDGIDNDNNGYVDDYYGINSRLEAGTDMQSGTDQHGLGVSGIIGAKGDNNELLAGMAWNIKMLNVTGANTNINAVRAYDYVHQLRKMYNETNGAMGAYIVASNNSFGADNRFPNQNPIWCDRYNLLTSVGILNVGAVRNDEVNIDEEGDIPGLCPADGLITVTNLTPDDQVGRSGFSPTNVDLATYGTFVPTLNNSDTVFFQSGTSFSAPHVTGLIGLFYGQACEAFIDLSKSAPERAALTMKSFIIEKALPIPSQLGRTLTEGKLDPRASQNLMFDYCGSSDSSLEIDRIYYNSIGELVVEFIIPDPGDVRFEIYNSLGQKFFDELSNVRFSEPWIYTIDVDNASSGIHYLTLSKDGNMTTQPFLMLRN